MATKAQIDLLVNTAESANSLKEFRQNIKNIQTAISEATDPKDVQRLQRALGLARDASADFNEKLKAVGQNTFERVATVGQVAAAGFQVATSAAALFGNEAQVLQETMMKVQAAMALTQGLGELAEAPRRIKDVAMAFGLLKATKMEDAAATGVQTAATKTQTVATQGANVASKGLKAALASIGIGLLISAIALLVANFDTIKKYFAGLSGDADKFGQKMAGITAVAKEVGMAMLNFVATPFKIVMKIMQGDFEGAAQAVVDAYKNIFNAVANSGETMRKAGENEAYIQGLEKQVANQEKAIKRLKSGSLEKLKAEEKLLQTEKELAKARGEDLSEIEDKIIAKKQEITDKQNQINQQNAQKAKASADKEYNEAIQAADREINERKKTYKNQKEIDDNSFKDQKDLLDEKIKIGKKFNKDTTQLEAERNKLIIDEGKKSYDRAAQQIADEIDLKKKSYKTKKELDDNTLKDDLDLVEKQIAIAKQFGQDTAALERQRQGILQQMDFKNADDRVKAIEDEYKRKALLVADDEKRTEKLLDLDIEKTQALIENAKKEGQSTTDLETQLNNLMMTRSKNTKDTLKQQAEVAKALGEISSFLSPEQIAKFGKMSGEEQAKFIDETKKRIADAQAAMADLGVGPNMFKIISGLEGADTYDALRELASFVEGMTKQMANNRLMELQNETEMRLDKLNGEEQKRLRGVEKGSEEEARIKKDFENKRKKVTEDAAKEEKRIRKEVALFEADLQIAKIGISIAEGIVKAAGNPLLIFAASAIGAVQLALAMQNREMIAKQKAERGGFLKGPSHAEGGIMLTDRIEAQGGEFIVNRESTTKFSETIQSINNDGGDALLSELRAMRMELANPVRSYVVYEDIETAADQREFIRKRTEI